MQLTEEECLGNLVSLMINPNNALPAVFDSSSLDNTSRHNISALDSDHRGCHGRVRHSTVSGY
jgi:hypothetical protein